MDPAAERRDHLDPLSIEGRTRSPSILRLLRSLESQGRGWGIFEIDLETRASRTLIDRRRSQSQQTLSSDGRWIAYSALEIESDRHEVYLTPYASPGAKHQVLAVRWVRQYRAH